MLRIANLSKHFQTPRGELVAVDDVSLEIPENKILGLVGESGSGKSTLGKTVIGLHGKTGGKINWQGEEMPKQFSRKDFLRFSKDIQMVFQDPYSALNPRMQVWQILEEPLLLSQNQAYLKLSKERRKHFIQEQLEQVGMRPEFHKRFPHEFSGGQQQRIGIARALISKPKLLICDEPVSALDVSVQAQIVKLLKSLQAEYRMSLLFIAHDLAMVNYLCEEVAVMYLGKIVEQGSSETIFFNPAHPYTKLLLSANPSLNQAEKLENKYGIPEIQGEIPSPIGKREGCGFVSRCWLAKEECRKNIPPLKLFDDGQSGKEAGNFSQEITRKTACFYPSIIDSSKH